MTALAPNRPVFSSAHFTRNWSGQQLTMSRTAPAAATHHPHKLVLCSAGDGTGEGLVRVYYSCVGWPTFLPSNEQDAFAGKVYQLKQQQMKKLIQEGGIPLRDGVTQVGGQAKRGVLLTLWAYIGSCSRLGQLPSARAISAAALQPLWK